MSGVKKDVLTPGISRQLFRNSVQPRLPLFRQRVVVFFQINLKRLHHPDDFFLADFLTPPNRVFVRAVIQQRIRDQFFATDQ